MKRSEIPADIVVSCAPEHLRKAVRCLEGAEPIMMEPSGEFPAYIVHADKLDELRELLNHMLADFERVNQPKAS